MDRKAARTPALSPSKHKIGSGPARHNSSSWSSVNAVPNGATAWAKPARESAMTSIYPSATIMPRGAALALAFCGAVNARLALG